MRSFLLKEIYLTNVGQTKRGTLSPKPKTLNLKRDTKRSFFMSLWFFGACHVVSISRTSSERITRSLGLVLESVARSFLSATVSTFFCNAILYLKNKHHDFLGKPVPKISHIQSFDKKTLDWHRSNDDSKFLLETLFLKKNVYGPQVLLIINFVHAGRDRSPQPCLE